MTRIIRHPECRPETVSMVVVLTSTLNLLEFSNVTQRGDPKQQADRRI
jgi:quinolinate synthase